MKRLLASTALALLVMSPAALADAHKKSMGGIYTEQARANDIYGSEFIGMRIYAVDRDLEEDETFNRETEKDWEDIGEVSDVLLTRNGKVKAVLIDVGGFLGLGEKTVAINMDDLRFIREEGEDGAEGEFFLAVKSSKEALEGAPEFATFEEAREERREARQELREERREAREDAREEKEELMEEKAEAREELREETAEADANVKVVEAEVIEAEEAETELNQAANEVETELKEAGETVEAELNEAETVVKTEMAEVEKEMDEELATAEMLRRPEMQVDGYKTVMVGTLTAEKLEGINVYGINNEDIGEVSDLVIKEDKITEAIIDVGGFLGLGEHRVAVSFDELQILTDEDGDDIRIYIDASEEALEQRPEWEG